MARNIDDIIQEFRKLTPGTHCNPARQSRLDQAREAAAWELMLDHNIPLRRAEELLLTIRDSRTS